MSPESTEQDSVNWVEESQTGEEESDWLGDIEGDTIVEAPPVQEVPAKVEPPAQEIPDAVVPTSVPEQTPTVPPVEVPAVDATVAFDPVAWERETLEGLEKSYGLSEAETQAFLTEPETVLPKLAAAMHMRVTKSILGAMQSMMPQMIAQQRQAATVEDSARNSFFAGNPDLDKPEYMSAIMQVGQMYRQVNPTAKKDDAIKTIGALVRVSLGLPSTTEVAQPVAQQTAVQTVKPFTPTRGGGNTAAPAKPNPWAELANFDDEM